MSGDVLAALSSEIAALAACPPGTALPDSAEHTVAELLARLEDGQVRAASDLLMPQPIPEVVPT